jgi:signal transduction histidine kinase
LAVWAAILYIFLSSSITANQDTQLDSRKNTLIEFLNQNRNQIGQVSQMDQNVALKEIDVLSYSTMIDEFKDTVLISGISTSPIKYRKLTTRYRNPDTNIHYKLSIYDQKVNDKILLKNLVIGVVFFFFGILAFLYFFNKLMLTKIWKPFEETLSRLKDFDLQKHDIIEYKSTKIVEFNELNKAVENLTIKSKKAYESQKHFVENTSHEIQTPLAVIKNKIELAFQNPELSENNAKILLEINEAANKLSKMNKTLLLLSRIENNQYVEQHDVNISSLTRKILGYFEDKIDAKRLKIHQEISPSIQVNGNKLMLEILITNLIKNAVYHNIEDGFIEVHVLEKMFVIKNSGEEITNSEENFFKRYKSGVNKSVSTGLGLSIINKICEVNSYKLNFHFSQSTYLLEVEFS